MRAAAIGLVGLFVLAASRASADSWLPPQPTLTVSRDGGWYLVLKPERGAQAAFALVERRAGAGPLEGAAQVDPKDRVVARGACRIPMHAWCLDGGRGFVLFDTYGQLGHGEVLTRHDAKGRRAWGLTLADLFTQGEVLGMRSSVSSVWWSRTRWLDASGEALWIVYEKPADVDPHAPVRGPNLGPQRGDGLLRVRVSDGSHARAPATDLLRGLADGSTHDRLALLEAIGRARPEGWQEALRGLLEDTEEASAVRVMAAVHLRRGGAAVGRDVVLEAARAKQPVEARALALEHLGTFLGDEALPILRAALRDGQRETGLPIYRALERRGAAILDTLVAMAQEADAPTGYRVVAVQLLGTLGAAGRPAAAALTRLAAGSDARLAEQARNALETIRAARP